MIKDRLESLYHELTEDINLVAVSKTKTIEDIMSAYNYGQRLFGENRALELTEKYNKLPKDIKWNMIGHLQSNKVKFIASFVDLIHSLDSMKLAKEINRQAEKNNRIINCLIQIKISKDDSKYGVSFNDFNEFFKYTNNLKFVNVVGLMGMASLTNDDDVIKNEFKSISSMYSKIKLVDKNFKYLSIGMSNDYKLAINEGGNMIRIGSRIFGERKI
ncbi:MAG: YggS family pyridoxal phosphate-dependent enzyme [Pelagibacterales bacterium]|nr:YggS family pyridoxal phosphate-dependent enzyme [Pelagibacterales bacterium]